MLAKLSQHALRAVAGLTSRASDRSGHRLMTLIYHRVLEEHDFMRPDEVTLDKFEWQMELLARFFRVYPLSEALQLQQAGELPARSVAITFDDGYADNYQTALPVLKRYGLHATFFVASGYLDGGRMWNDSVLEAVRLIEAEKLDWSEEGIGVFDLSSTKRKAEAGSQILRNIKHKNPQERARLTEAVVSRSPRGLPDGLMMTSQQLQKLSASGMGIGGHTVSHPILATLSSEESRREIVHGKQALEAIIDQPVSLFAYPNGRAGADYQPKDAENVSNSGFSAAVTTHWGVSERSTDPYQLPRFTPWDATPTGFMTRMANMYRNVVRRGLARLVVRSGLWAALLLPGGGWGIAEAGNTEHGSASLQSQIDAAKDGYVRLEPGIYRRGAVIRSSNLTVSGNGARVSGVVAAKGVFLIKGDNVTLEDVEISLGEGNWINEACVRIEGKNTILNRISCTDTQMGILAGGRLGTIRITDSSFSRTGINATGNLGHGIYIGSNSKSAQGNELFVVNSRLTDIGVHRPGHAIKSRTRSNTFDGILIDSGEGKTGRLLELPNGGYAEVKNSTFILREQAENFDVFSIGYERMRGTSFPATLLLHGNVVDCQKTEGCIAVSGELVGEDRVQLDGNVFTGHFRKLEHSPSHFSGDIPAQWFAQ